MKFVKFVSKILIRLMFKRGKKKKKLHVVVYPSIVTECTQVGVHKTKYIQTYKLIIKWTFFLVLFDAYWINK